MPQTIEFILDKLVDSYQTDSPINNLSTCSLPNRREVISAFQHIQHLVFLGYYTQKDLHEESLRIVLGEHLLAAYDILFKQTQRAILWQLANPSLGTEPTREECPKTSLPLHPISERMAQAETWCSNVLNEFFTEIPTIRSYLADDVDAAFVNDPAATTVEDIVFSYPGIVAVTAYRVANALHRLNIPMIPRIITEFAHSKTGIDIHPAAQIGRRFFIDHGTGVVIGATCVIGACVVLYQGVTLGALHVDPNAAPYAQRHPTIEDDVTIYAGSTILGGKTVIGKGSTIGGNVWLIDSVPPFSRVYNTSASNEIKPHTTRAPKPKKKKSNGIRSDS